MVLWQVSKKPLYALPVPSGPYLMGHPWNPQCSYTHGPRYAKNLY